MSFYTLLASRDSISAASSVRKRGCFFRTSTGGISSTAKLSSSIRRMLF